MNQQPFQSIWISRLSNGIWNTSSEAQPREREVCSRAAAGKTIEGTARDLNIRKTSVITYRQRAYQKLGISRQNELVALVNNLKIRERLELRFSLGSSQLAGSCPEA